MKGWLAGVCSAALIAGSGGAGPSYLAPSYANQFGSGDRKNADLVITHNASIGSGTVENILDGATATNAFWWQVNSLRWVQFAFPYAVKITEVKWYQDIATSHGVWRWEASNDLAAWTVVSGNFTLGGAATTTHDLSGNANRYLYYKLVQQSGGTATGSWQREIEFKLDQPDPYPTHSYLNPMGKGNRTASITTVISSNFSGTPANLVNGNEADNSQFFTAGGTTVSCRFQFPTAKRLHAARVLRSGANANGTWKWQGSPDGVTWTDTSTAQVWTPANMVFNMDLGITTPFLYHRCVMTAGTTSGTPWVWEFLFDIYA